MPGRSVKRWPQYETLRDKGFSKKRAARITNASVAKGKRKKRRG